MAMTLSPTGAWDILKSTWVAFYNLFKRRIVVQQTTTAADNFTILDQYDIDRAGAEFMDAVINAEAAHREDRLLLERARMRIQDLEAQLGVLNQKAQRGALNQTSNADEDHAMVVSKVGSYTPTRIATPTLEPESVPTDIDSDDGDASIDEGHAGSHDVCVESVSSMTTEGDTIMAEPVGVTIAHYDSFELLLASQ